MSATPKITAELKLHDEGTAQEVVAQIRSDAARLGLDVAAHASGTKRVIVTGTEDDIGKLFKPVGN